MPCYPMKQRKFEVIKERTRQAQADGTMNFTKREETRRNVEDLYAEVKEKLEDHIKALERLKERLRRATSEQERAQLEKEIAELEDEISKYEDILQEMVEFMRDLERRTIQAPNKQANEQ